MSPFFKCKVSPPADVGLLLAILGRTGGKHVRLSNITRRNKRLFVGVVSLFKRRVVLDAASGAKVLPDRDGIGTV